MNMMFVPKVTTLYMMTYNLHHTQSKQNFIRTRGVRSKEHADALLENWNETGRLANRKELYSYSLLSIDRIAC